MFLILNKKIFYVFGIFVLIILIVCANNPHAIRTSVERENIPIYSVKTNERKIAITFDSAWEDSDLTEILNILDNYKCPATFFVVGDFVDRYPERIREIHKRGHEVANHTDTHPHTNSLSREKLIEEMDNCDKKIKNITGQDEVLFRAPYGEYNNLLVQTCKDTERFCIQWDVDSLDWKGLTADMIVKRVTENANNGSIVLLHNGTDNTAEALPAVLCQLQNRGFTFVTVSDLIYKDNYYVDHTGLQISNDDM